MRRGDPTHVLFFVVTFTNNIENTIRRSRYAHKRTTYTHARNRKDDFIFSRYLLERDVALGRVLRGSSVHFAKSTRVDSEP